MKALIKNDDKPRCGLCGKTKNLTKTECCGNWICDDEHKYVIFSYARNSCHRNHSHYTLCAYHFNEGHEGDWKTCKKCRESCETELYVWYGTNEYNFTKLENPPSYKPTKCIDCGCVIALGTDGYSSGADGYRCQQCSDMYMENMAQQLPAEKEKEKKQNQSSNTSIADNVVHLPKLTPPARTRWNKIPKSAQDGILQSVWCVDCKGSVMKLKSGKMKRGMLVLEGTCVQCGGKVVRCVEPED